MGRRGLHFISVWKKPPRKLHAQDFGCGQFLREREVGGEREEGEKNKKKIRNKKKKNKKKRNIHRLPFI